MNGALSKGTGEKKGEQSREIGLVHGALVKVTKLQKGWEGRGGGQKGKSKVISSLISAGKSRTRVCTSWKS